MLNVTMLNVVLPTIIRLGCKARKRQALYPIFQNCKIHLKPCYCFCAPSVLDFFIFRKTSLIHHSSVMILKNYIENLNSMEENRP
jgi:hypothetical protein